MHWRAGNVKWPLVPRLGFFAAVGAVGGGYVAVHAPEEFLLGSSPQHLTCLGPHSVYEKQFRIFLQCRWGGFVFAVHRALNGPFGRQNANAFTPEALA